MPEELRLTSDEQAVHEWATARKISMESVKCLLKDSFTSLDALQLLEKEDLSHKIPRGQQRLILHAVGESQHDDGVAAVVVVVQTARVR